MNRQTALTVMNKNLRRQLAQITPKAAPQEFYDTISYNKARPGYARYITELKGKRQPTAQELKCLITHEFRCNYDFTCADMWDFNHKIVRPFSADEELWVTRDRIIVTYFDKHDYQKCLDEIATRPAITQYQLITAVHIKSLFWCGRFQEAYDLITKEQRITKMDDEDKIFHYLQKTLCALRMNEKLKTALMNCTAAARLAKKPNSDTADQLPAILWIRAHVHQALAAPTQALKDLDELAAQMDPRELMSVLNVLSPDGLNYLNQYKKLITKEIK